MLKKYVLSSYLASTIFASITASQFSHDQLENDLITAGFKQFAQRTGLLYRLEIKKDNPSAIAAAIRFACGMENFALGEKPLTPDQQKKLFKLVLPDSDEELYT